MAGIGFELRKLYEKDGIYNKSKAAFISIATISGPTIIITTFLLFFNVIGIIYNINTSISLSSSTYCMIFSIIVTSPIILVLSRYISDMIFLKKIDRILPSLYGSISISIFIGSIISIKFLSYSKINFYIKILIYLFLIELIILWIVSIFVSILKDYKKVSKGFFIGIIFSSLIFLILNRFFSLSINFVFYISIILGFFITISLLWIEIHKVLPNNNKDIFDFMRYFLKHYELIFVNLFLILGVYTQSFYLWFSTNSINIDIFRVYPQFDMVLFISFLSILPANIVFIVKFETKFYLKVKKFLNKLENNGFVDELNLQIKNIYNFLLKELRFISEIQIVFIICTILTILKLSSIYTGFNINYYFLSITLFACFFYFLLSSILLIILYYDDKKGALLLSIIFILSNISFLIVLNYFNIKLLGLSFLISSLVTSLVSLFRLLYFTKNLDYLIFRKSTLQI